MAHTLTNSTTITWPGKRPPTPCAPPPVRLLEEWGLEAAGAEQAAFSQAALTPLPDQPGDSLSRRPNALFHGDNRAGLSHLLATGQRGQVRLIYADPPYNSGVTWPRKVRLRTGNASTRDAIIDHQTQYVDAWAEGDYLQFIYERLWEMRDLLADDGSLWLHCDHRHAHHLRCLLDEVFGIENFLNTITWRSQTARGAKVNAFYFANSAHTIHVFAKNRQAPTVWHQPKKRLVLTEVEAAAEFMHDAHGFFRTSDPGTYSFARLKELHAAGRLYAPYSGQVLIDENNRRMVCSNGGSIGVKYYLTDLGNGHHAVERAVDNVWDDIPGLGTTPAEDVGYPTQKTEALLRRIIETATNPGDLVLDPFVGSGATVIAAQKLARRWLGCDLNYGAIQTTRRRLQRTIGADAPGFAIYRIASPSSAFVQRSLIEPLALVDVTRTLDGAEIEVKVHDYAVADMPTVNDWRAVVENIDIDPTYDGGVFRGTLADAPHKRSAQVRGRYRLAVPPSSNCVAVRITDVWGRETLVVQQLADETFVEVKRS